MEKVKRPVKSKVPKTKVKLGCPPFPYTTELAKEICAAIEISTEDLEAICARHSHFPGKDTVYSWRANNKDFSEMYHEAKRRQVQAYVEESFTLANEIDDSNPGSSAKAKINIDLRKWYAARLVPRLYGDKIQAEELSAEAEQLKSTVAQLQATIALLKKHERDY